jgi:hypothetical protein
VISSGITWIRAGRFTMRREPAGADYPRRLQGFLKIRGFVGCSFVPFFSGLAGFFGFIVSLPKHIILWLNDAQNKGCLLVRGSPLASRNFSTLNALRSFGAKAPRRSDHPALFTMPGGLLRALVASSFLAFLSFFAIFFYSPLNCPSGALRIPVHVFSHLLFTFRRDLSPFASMHFYFPVCPRFPARAHER